MILTRLVASVFILGSSIAFAGAMGDKCVPGEVTLPCKNTGWDFSAKALFLQPSWGEINYPAYQIENNLLEFRNLSTSWNWGFMLEGDYQFSNDNDVSLNWSHLDYSNTKTLYGPSTSTSTGATSTSPTIYKTTPSWDAVNLEVAHQANYGKDWQVRYHGGAEYVRINFQRRGVSSTTNKGSQRSYLYSGGGPRGGVDTSFKIRSNLFGYLKTAVGLYAGSSSLEFNTFNQPGSPDRRGSSMLVVPEIEGKLGVLFAYRLSHGEIALDGGWMWINYINAITSGDDKKINIYSFGMQGPYLGLKWTV